MSTITIPQSGSVISAASIEGMFETVRLKANTLTVEDHGRMALGPQHFKKASGGVLRASDFRESLVSTGITGTMTDETLADIVASWTPLGSSELDGTGTGYALNGPCWAIWYANLRLKEWSAGVALEHMAWFAATYAVDGGAEQLCPLMPVGLHGQQYANGTQEQSLSWWGAIDFTAKAGAWNLDFLKFRMARCQAGSGIGLPANFVIPHASTGILIFKAE
jgi:hypothetical protein